MDNLNYSFNGNYPEELPASSKLKDGTVVNLENLTQSELESLGWYGPIEMLPIRGTTYHTHNYEWNSNTYSFDAVEISEQEKIERLNYTHFWNMLFDGVEDINTGELSGGIAYKKIKSESKQSLEINTISTEFIALLTDAKNNNPNKHRIQENLSEIISLVPFTPEELVEIRTIFFLSGMSVIYNLE